MMAPLRAACLLFPACLALLTASLASISLAALADGATGLLIVVSFPNLAYDVELLACEDDAVVSLAPPGVDPHDYQLTPSDVELLRRADLVVSTAHAPFEADIRRLAEEGRLSAVLVELPRVPGVRLLANPITGQPNYHMPIYDPGNYRAFLSYLADVMAELRPGMAGHYECARQAALERLDELERTAPRLNLMAAADLPVVQYAVSWLGVELSFLMVKEHGTPATPGDIMELEEAFSGRSVRLAVVCEPAAASASERLLELAEEHQVPVLYVPSPLAPTSVLEKLSTLVGRASTLAGGWQGQGDGGQAGGVFRRGASEAALSLAVPVLTASSLSASVVLYGRRRR